MVGFGRGIGSGIADGVGVDILEPIGVVVSVAVHFSRPVGAKAIDTASIGAIFITFAGSAADVVWASLESLRTPDALGSFVEKGADPLVEA